MIIREQNKKKMDVLRDKGGFIVTLSYFYEFKTEEFVCMFKCMCVCVCTG